MINNVSFDSKFSSLATVDQEFSDDSLELIQQWSQYYGDCFLKSEVAKLALSKKALEEFPFILSSFCDFCYSYYLQKPGQWMSDAVSDVLLNIMPRKVMADDAFFSQAALVLINFLTWMETEKYLSDIQAIKETMLAVEDDILKQAKNPNNWGLAKSLFSGMPLSKNTTSKQARRITM
ncbi:hypothetical protein [Candidiatus Paracoxiella cheracis]|uniref:hypothetical protein n=1 Tax=Candidiatus Paracoxiella cheracis TaxID=3405120 RepID=UPI003BF5627B